MTVVILNSQKKNARNVAEKPNYSVMRSQQPNHGYKQNSRVSTCYT